MLTQESIEAAKYYSEALVNLDRVDSAYKRGEATREDLDSAWETRRSAFENLKRLEQAATDDRPVGE
jgi:hypothetical protein